MKLPYLLALLFFAAQATAQTETAYKSKHAANLFFELAGNGGTVSLNYDQRFAEGSGGLGARIGVGLGVLGSTHLGFPDFGLMVPIGLNYLVGTGPHHLELGAGITFCPDGFSPVKNRSPSTRFFVPSIGYRYQSQKARSVFRAFLSPFIGKDGGLFGGISYGWRF